MVLIRKRNEHTIAGQALVSGRGYWSGRGINVRFLPAAAGTGVRFVRTDLPGKPEVEACVENRSDIALRTVLQKGEARVEMVEHVMAALYGLGIDNCVVEVDASEMPGLDGSSAGFVYALRTAGLVMQAKLRRQIIVDTVFRVGSSDAWVEAAPALGCQLIVRYQLNYGSQSPVPAHTVTSVVTPESFGRELGAARTFVTAEQANQLRSAGHASHVTNRDLLVFGENGPVDNILRYPDECARHKALDMVGDLSLVDAELVGTFTSYRGGHQLNGMMASELCKLAASVPVGCRNAA